MNTRVPPFDHEGRRLTLGDQMAILIQRANQMDGREVRIQLSHGLTITMKYTFEPRELILQLSRQDTFPSVTEWNTVMKAIPGGAEELDEHLEAGQDPRSGAYFLRSRIKPTPLMI